MRQAAIVVALGLVATSELPSQITRTRANADPSAADIAGSLRTYARAGGAVAVLTQARGPQSPQKMDEIADTLLAFAINFPGEDLRGASTRGAALAALVSAGMGHPGIAGEEHGIPYAGAVDRLMRIAEGAQSVGIRGAAVQSLARLPHSPAILPFLRQVATSTSPVAHAAVEVLANQTGTEGRAIAHDLYQNNEIIEPLAKRAMAGIASAYGWH